MLGSNLLPGRLGSFFTTNQFDFVPITSTNSTAPLKTGFTNVTLNAIKSFNLFPKLPIELQIAIWELAAPDPVPEVCIAWPTFVYLNYPDTEQLTGPLLVDTAWSAVTHACRTAREALLRSGRLRLRHSSVAGFPVPFRAFDPAMDTFYWSCSQNRAALNFFQQPQNAHLGPALRHFLLIRAILGRQTG